MDAAVDHGQAHVDRRLRLAVRLVIYPLALGLIVLAWHRYHGESTPTKVVSWTGVTARGQVIQALTAKGRLVYFEFKVGEGCTNGSVFTYWWRRGKSAYVQNGQHVWGSDSGPGEANNGYPVVYDDQMSARIGDRLSGTISASVSWIGVEGRVQCSSGSIPFALDRVPTP
jgi:hypothetical protein